MNLFSQSISSLDLLSQLTDAVIAIDLEGRILFWNQGAVRLYGWTEREALGQSAHELLNTRSAEPIEPLIDSLLRESRWEGELTRHSRSGEPIDVLSRWSLIRNAEGSPIARVLIDSDLTETRLRFHELRLAEERAREAAATAANRESLLGCLLDGISDCAYLKDPESRYLAVNAATASFFGKSPEEMMGKTDAELFPLEKAREVLAQDKQILASGQPLSIEEEVPSSSGPQFFHTIKSLCRDRSGKVIGLVGLSRDMRERKQLEQALKLRERELTEAHRIAGLGTWHWDRATDEVTWSDEIYRIYGKDRSFKPLGYAQFRKKENVPASERRFVEHFERAFLFGEPYALDIEITRDDGTTRWIIARGQPDEWQDGRVVSLRGTVIEITERKRLELELRERERQLTESHRIAKIGSWRWHRKTDATVWSAETFRLFGLDPSEPAPGFDRLLKLHSPSSARRIAAAVERALRFGESYECDVELLLDDGTVRWISAHGEVESWEDGEAAILRGTVHDITERKRNEREIALGENRYRSLIHASAQIVWVTNADGNQMNRLPAWQAFTGQSDQEVLGFGWADAIHPDDRPRSVRLWEECIASGEPYNTEERVRRHDGVYCDMAVRAVPVRDDAGCIIEWVGTHTDVTERKRHEAQIALSENRYRSLVHASTQMVWVSNTEGAQLGSIPAWQAFTGQSDAEVLGYGWADAIHPDDREATVAAWRHATETGSTFTLEHRLRRHDGVYRTMAVRAVPVHDPDGKIVEWVGTHTDITEQKDAETELHLAHERLQNVMDSITDGLAILDRELRYTYFNKNGAESLGLRPEDIVGKRLGDIFAENRTNDVANRYRHALSTGEPSHFEIKLSSPHDIWTEVHCYPSAQGLTVYFRDISERKRTEAALRASESRFRKLFESDLMGIAIPDRFGAFKEGNNELLRITGYTREELEAGLVRWDTMTPPEYEAMDIEHIAEAAERGACTPYEKEYIRKDGTRIPVLCGYVLLEGSQDEYLGFILDISRQRAAEAELREREQRFRLLAESLPELVWISDPTGSLTYLNSRFLEYCGISPENVVGFDWYLILHPEEASYVIQRWSRTVELSEPYLIELRLRAHDGSFRHFLARALPMRDERGEVLRWVGSCTDIHDQKLAEEALRRSEKLAATGRLAASIAHEINNPLSSVTNSLYLALQDPNLSEETRFFLRTAEQELTRVTHITTQTLRFHRQSKAASIADLSDTMASVLTLFGPRLMARKIDVRRELEPGARLLCFDDELRQVFANLVSNSLDATAEGERIWIRVRKVAGGIRVTVADTGCGIPAQARKRIFEPFFSTKDTTGIGLGLWVSDGILRKHRGRLSLRSATDCERHGTAISIFLPWDGVAAPAS